MPGPGAGVIAEERIRLMQETTEILSAQTYGQERAEPKAASAAHTKTLWDGETCRSRLEANEPASLEFFIAFSSRRQHSTWYSTVRSRPARR